MNGFLSLTSLSGEKVQWTFYEVFLCSSCYGLIFIRPFSLLYCWKVIKYKWSLNFLKETNKIHMTPEDCYSFYEADSKLGISKHFLFGLFFFQFSRLMRKSRSNRDTVSVLGVGTMGSEEVFIHPSFPDSLWEFSVSACSLYFFCVIWWAPVTQLLRGPKWKCQWTKAPCF